MQTFILPGFSTKNLEWAQTCQKELGADQSTIIEWKHWQTGSSSDFSAYEEAKKIKGMLPSGEYNILAKSIGTLVAMQVLHDDTTRLNKLILCGIPMGDVRTPEEMKHYEVLSTIPAHKVKIFQNENDPHGSYKKVSEFIQSVAMGQTVISTPRSDHDYPFYEEFKKLLG